MTTRKTTMKRDTEAAEVVVIAYKGFSQDWKYRDFQYAVGGTYTHEGKVAACKSGYHACEYPLDVLSYYAPNASRFAIVEQSGTLARHDEDSKIASSKITIKGEIGLSGLIKAAIEYTFSRAKPEGGASATGTRGAASATGYAGRVMGAAGCALFLVERDPSYKIVSTWAGIVGRDGIKPNVWYTLRGGKPVEVKR